MNAKSTVALLAVLTATLSLNAQTPAPAIRQPIGRLPPVIVVVPASELTREVKTEIAASTPTLSREVANEIAALGEQARSQLALFAKTAIAPQLPEMTAPTKLPAIVYSLRQHAGKQGAKTVRL